MIRTPLHDWTFQRTDIPAHGDPAVAEIPSTGYTDVTVPHDWLIFDTRALYADGIGWYRRPISWEALDDGGAVYLYFEGVYQDVTVYLDGEPVGMWKYGYSSFYVELSRFAEAGTHDLVVKVVHQSPNSRWYSGAGIYRPVYLLTVQGPHWVPDGVYVHTETTLKAPGEGDRGHIRIFPELHAMRPDTGIVRATLTDDEGHLAADAVAKVSALGYVPADGPTADAALTPSRDGTWTAEVPLELTVHSPRLWSQETPTCYRLTLTLYGDDDTETPVDRLTQTVGFRTITMDPDRGLLVNGEPTILHGVCEHHDLGALGAVYHPAAARRKLQILKGMGVQALRTSHNMPAPHLMTLCDEMGILVVSEAFDMWRQPKTEYDYARFFDAWHARDVASWIRRDRNHPSLLMWSLGNEIYDTHAGDEGRQTLLTLMNEVRRHDPLGNARMTFGSNYLAWEPTQRAADELKVVGYNYAENLYDDHHAKYPDWIIYGSETASIVQSRGVYRFPLETPILSDDDQQCSALGNSATSWGAPNFDYLFEREAETPFSLGQFIWTGFDYIGEPTPYHTKNSYFGQIDTAGFPKDAYYHFRAVWCDPETHPTVHVAPYWDHNPGQLIDVVAVSNGAEVELELNGESYGRRTLDRAAGSVRAVWQVPYAPGTLRCTAYDAAGEVMAVDEVTSFGDAAATRLTASADTLSTDELLFVTIEAEDAEGRRVANANHQVRVTVEGAGQLVGLDNGDSTDYDSYKGRVRRLFNGKLLAIVQPTAEGTVTVKVEGENLPDASLTRTIQAADIASEDHPLCILPRSLNAEADRTKAPKRYIRKAELHADTEGTVTPEHATFAVTATLYPRDPAPAIGRLEWQITDDKGVPSPLASFETDPEDPCRILVTVKGDGRFIVRALPFNDKAHADFISVKAFEAEGFGPVAMSPYRFISASLYSATSGGVTSGNDRGIATMRDGATWIAFERLDFGPAGSDSVTIPIFSFEDDTRIRLYAGRPDDPDAEVLYDDIYHLPRIWNVYQDYHFKLRRPLVGQETFAIELESKAHIKGFVFDASDRAYRTLQAAEADTIYGDSFRRAGTAVEKIGNNVALVFDEMAFGQDGAVQLTLEGRTRLPSNSVHLLIEGEGETRRELLEFPKREAYDTVTFDMPPIRGTRKITLMFMPGSDMDLRSLRFRRADDKVDEDDREAPQDTKGLA